MNYEQMMMTDPKPTTRIPYNETKENLFHHVVNADHQYIDRSLFKMALRAYIGNIGNPKHTDMAYYLNPVILGDYVDYLNSRATWGADAALSSDHKVRVFNIKLIPVERLPVDLVILSLRNNINFGEEYIEVSKPIETCLIFNVEKE